MIPTNIYVQCRYVDDFNMVHNKLYMFVQTKCGILCRIWSTDWAYGRKTRTTYHHEKSVSKSVRKFNPEIEWRRSVFAFRELQIWVCINKPNRYGWDLREQSDLFTKRFICVGYFIFNWWLQRHIFDINSWGLKTECFVLGIHCIYFNEPRAPTIHASYNLMETIPLLIPHI